MYVYKRMTEKIWNVGFYHPDYSWESESEHGSAETAANRVHWLNGGSGDDGGPIATRRCRNCGGIANHDDLCIENGSRCRQALRIVQQHVNFDNDLTEFERPNLRQAMNTLEDIIKQRGCEHWEGDGWLTSLMDIAIYG